MNMGPIKKGRKIIGIREVPILVYNSHEDLMS